MKKWYVVTGILALFLVISLSTCSSNSAEVNELSDDIAAIEDELIGFSPLGPGLRADINKLEGSLNDIEDVLGQILWELKQQR